jgi:hypothetical protein
MSRIGFVSKPLILIYYEPSVGEFSSINVDLYTKDLKTIFKSFMPKPSPTLVGLQRYVYYPEQTGEYKLNWSGYSDQPHLVVNKWEELVIVDENSFYTVSDLKKVGDKYFPNLGLSEGSSVKYSLYQIFPGSEKLIGTYDLNFNGKLYIYDSGIDLVNSGTYLGVWTVNNTYFDFEVFDVIEFSNQYLVTLGFINETTGKLYTDLDVYITDGNNKTEKWHIETGFVSGLLKSGTYTITIYKNSNIIFNRNNFRLAIKDNEHMTFKVDHVELALSLAPEIPDSLKSVMHVKLLKGPRGKAVQGRKLIVEQLSVFKDPSSGIIIEPGSFVYDIPQNGILDVTMIRGTLVRVSVDTINATFTVPDKAEFNLTDVPSKDPFTIVFPQYELLRYK